MMSKTFLHTGLGCNLRSKSWATNPREETMAKKSAESHKRMLKQVKEQMAEAGEAELVDADRGKYRTVFTRDRIKVGDSVRDEGLTKKQAVSKMRRKLLRQERRVRYKQIMRGTYVSGLKFEHTKEEEYGNMLQFNDDAPEYWLTKNNVAAKSVVLLVNSSSYDFAHEGRMVQVLTSNGNILDARAGWLDAVD